MRQRALWLAGIITGLLTWWASPELASPARALTAILLGPAPAAFIAQAKSLDEWPRPFPRLPVYITSIITLWLMAGLTWMISRDSGFSPRLLGLVPVAPPVFWMWTAFGVLAAGALVAAFKAFGVRETAIMREIVPVTRREKTVFVGLSISAGICEELTFRSFLVPALMVATGSLFTGIALSALAFGLLHAHQSAAGALRAAMLGIILSIPLVLTGSVFASMAAHAIIDIVGGIWLSRWLVE